MVNVISLISSRKIVPWSATSNSPRLFGSAPVKAPTSDPSTIHHVAIWIGNNQIIEAPNSGSYVKISTMYYNGFIGGPAGRLTGSS